MGKIYTELQHDVEEAKKGTKLSQLMEMKYPRASQGTRKANRVPKLTHGRTHFFLSHYQANAGDTCASLKSDLKLHRGGTEVWFNQDNDPTEQVRANHLPITALWPQS